MPRPSLFSIVLSADERALVESRARKYTLPYFQVIRAKIVLMAANGLSKKEIGKRLDVPRSIVSKWRKRFHEHRLAVWKMHRVSGIPPVFPSSRRAS